MHDSVLRYLDEMVERLDLSKKSVLEIGSFNVNGSAREFFDGYYVGVDKRFGPGVDYVANSNDLPDMLENFDVVVCTEMLEHDMFPWKTVANIYDALKNEGCFIVTARGYTEQGCYPMHDGGDYWRFSKDGMHYMLWDAGFFVIDLREDDPPGVLATCKKGRPR